MSNHEYVRLFRRRKRPSYRKLTGEELHTAVRQQAEAFVSGDVTRDEFLAWIHDVADHDAPDIYQDLVEMDCLPPTADAGEGRWWREDPEAEPLRWWTEETIRALARGEEPRTLPEGWEQVIYSKF